MEGWIWDIAESQVGNIEEWNRSGRLAQDMIDEDFETDRLEL